MTLTIAGAPPPPPLVLFCRGASVPPIVSSGPDMLLLFRSSPFASPRGSPFGIHGFELEVFLGHFLKANLPFAQNHLHQVEIDFVDLESGRFSPRERVSGSPDCRFTFTSVSRRFFTFLCFAQVFYLSLFCASFLPFSVSRRFFTFLCFSVLRSFLLRFEIGAT